ncbi:MAG: hypothetical protein INQ03_16960 [Candidatus Heimdallarchaeota archaeon]|nr:hypothetical protein [Candidatus Heimdallarchaeota archaeon]
MINKNIKVVGFLVLVFLVNFTLMYGNLFLLNMQIEEFDHVEGIIVEQEAEFLFQDDYDTISYSLEKGEYLIGFEIGIFEVASNELVGYVCPTPMTDLNDSITMDFELSSRVTYWWAREAPGSSICWYDWNVDEDLDGFKLFMIHESAPPGTYSYEMTIYTANNSYYNIIGIFAVIIALATGFIYFLSWWKETEEKNIINIAKIALITFILILLNGVGIFFYFRYW